MRLVFLSVVYQTSSCIRLIPCQTTRCKGESMWVHVAASYVGQCCKEMDHFMREGASQQISLFGEEISTVLLFDRLENKDKLPVDEHRGGFKGCSRSKWKASLHRDAGEIGTRVASLRHPMLLPVALSGSRLATCLDSPFPLLAEQAWHVAQGCNRDSRAKRAGGPVSLIHNGMAQDSRS